MARKTHSEKERAIKTQENKRHANIWYISFEIKVQNETT